MSHEISDCYRSYEELLRRARKEHCCDACKETIRVGDRYARIFIRDSDGQADTIKRCLRCQELHEHLRSLAPGELWPAERLDCGEEYADHWGDGPPEDIAKLAFLTKDEMQARRAP